MKDICSKVKTSILTSGGSNPVRLQELCVAYKGDWNGNLKQEVAKFQYDTLEAFFEDHVDQFSLVGGYVAVVDSSKNKHNIEMIDNKSKANRAPNSNQYRTKAPYASQEQFSDANRIPLNGSSPNFGFFGNLGEPPEKNTRSQASSQSNLRPVLNQRSSPTCSGPYSALNVPITSPPPGFSFPPPQKVSSLFNNKVEHPTDEFVEELAECTTAHTQASASNHYFTIDENDLKLAEDKLDKCLNEVIASPTPLAFDILNNIIKRYGLQDFLKVENISEVLKTYKSFSAMKEGIYLWAQRNTSPPSKVETAANRLRELLPISNLRGKVTCCVLEDATDYLAVYPDIWDAVYATMNRELHMYKELKCMEPALCLMRGQVVLHNDKGTYYRGRVQAIENDLVKIYQVDTGKQVRAHRDSLFKLPGHFLNYHPLCVLIDKKTNVSSEKVMVQFPEYCNVKGDLEVYIAEYREI